MTAPARDVREDAYIAYIRRFFGRWIGVYDLFARPIGFAYAAAARHAGCAPGVRVLDVCTGTGEMAIRCARLGAAVTAIDVTPPMLDRAVAKARGLAIDFRLMDARALDFPADSFDVAILSFALHDMPRAVRPQVLGEATRVARAVIVLDYDFPAREPWHALVARLVALYETAYLPDFARQGLGPIFDAAGLDASLVARPVPRFCAIYSARRRDSVIQGLPRSRVGR